MLYNSIINIIKIQRNSFVSEMYKKKSLRKNDSTYLKNE